MGTLIINPYIELEHLIEELQVKLKDYRSSKTSTIKGIKNRIEHLQRLEDILNNMKFLFRFEVWVQVEKEIDRLMSIDPEVGKIMIILPIQHNKNHLAKIDLS